MSLLVDHSYSTEIISPLLHNTPVISWILFVAFGTFGEMLFGKWSEDRISSRLVNILNGCVVCLAYLFVIPAMTVVCDVFSKIVGLGLIDLRPLSSGSFMTQFCIALVYIFLYDLFYYWLHFAQHHCYLLWIHHAVHHSDVSFNTTTYLRQHWSEVILQSVAVSLPLIILFKMDATTVWIVAQVTIAWNCFVHMNIDLSLGRWSWVINGPHLHRLHHSIFPTHQAKNLAAYFPVIDVLFKTYQPPNDSQYPPVGLSCGRRLDSVYSLATWPIAELIRRLFYAQEKILSELESGPWKGPDDEARETYGSPCRTPSPSHL